MAATCKTVEIRDAATFIPALAIKPAYPRTEGDRYLFDRAGYGCETEDHGRYVILMRLAGGNDKATCDPYDWDTRTMQVAHRWLIEHWDEHESGGVVDVEFILGLRGEPKESESSGKMYR